jgi:hypothetical protein
MCPGPEAKHYHHCLAEAARHKKIVAFFYLPCCPDPNCRHSQQIQSQDTNIRNVQSKHNIHSLEADDGNQLSKIENQKKTPQRIRSPRGNEKEQIYGPTTVRYTMTLNRCP